MKAVSEAFEKECYYCNDFSSQTADISVGSIGSQNGYSTIIVRTDLGKRLLENLEFTKAKASETEIINAEKAKTTRAEKFHHKNTRRQQTSTEPQNQETPYPPKGCKVLHKIA